MIGASKKMSLTLKPLNLAVAVALVLALALTLTLLLTLIGSSKKMSTM